MALAENQITLEVVKDGRSGSVGPQGPKGDKGDTGEQGPQGPQGLPGQDGADGVKGDKGDTGATGPRGPQGEPGADGKDGAAGPQGPKGDTGATGPQGPTGPKGADGEDGAQGPKGDTGARGPQGPTGPKGADGTDGADGKSAYESAQDGGYSGTEAQFNSNLAEVPKTIAHFYFDENGAHVLSGDYRTDVKDGLQIVRNADSVPLASFEDKLVKIGEDSQDAEVQLCGGAGGIKYDKSAHRLHIGNKMDGAERIIIETNFDTYGYESGPYGTVQLSRSDGTAAKEGKFNIYASDGQDGKEAYIEAVCRSTPDSAPYEMLENGIDIIARNIFMGTEMFNNATIELDANNVIIGKKNGVQFDTAHNVKMYGNVTVDDFKVLTEGDIGYTITRTGGTHYTTDLSSGTNTIKDVATISLPPGLWLVMINSRFTPTNSGTHITSMALTENSESAAVHDRRYGSTTYYNQHNFTTLVDLRNKSAGTTMYLTGQSTLAGSWNRKSSAQLSIKAIQMGL